MVVELAFRISSQRPIPADHGYFLYAAVSRELPAMHADNGIGSHWIRGRQAATAKWY
jgi:hypothetical protein